MKIAVVSCHTPSLFWFRMDMMKHFMSLGHEVVAIGNESEQEWAQKFADNNIRYIKVDISRNGMNPLDEIKAYKSVKKVLKAEMPDRIFCYQAKSIISSCLAAHSLKIKEIYPLVAGLGSVFLHDGLKFKLAKFVLKLEYKLSLKHTSNVFFQNNDDIEFFVANGLVKKDKIVLINGSGVNLERFQKQKLINGASFLCISRLIRDKGVIEYLNAAKIVKEKYPDTKFMLVGPFDTNPSAIGEADLKPFVDDNIVEYYGEQSDVLPYLGKCNVFVLPSYREGTPKTVLEAMATCKAIITTDAPGCRETVENGKNGFLVPIKSADAVAEKMIYLIENPKTIAEMAQFGRKIVEEKYDVNIVNNVISNTMKINNEV